MKTSEQENDQPGANLGLGDTIHLVVMLKIPGDRGASKGRNNLGNYMCCRSQALLNELQQKW